jgi:uncharacterized OB-fold protein
VSDAALVPLPVPDEDTRPFWEGCKRRELLMQRCAECGRFRFYPRRMCPQCQSVAGEWVPVSGNGTIYSRVLVHPPVLPAFADRVPYAVVLVELDEDPSLRLVGNVLDCPPEEVRIGRPVQVVFQDVSEEIALPQWRVVE